MKRIILTLLILVFSVMVCNASETEQKVVKMDKKKGIFLLFVLNAGSPALATTVNAMDRETQELQEIKEQKEIQEEQNDGKSGS